jgi:hypothetical protein
MKVYAAIKNVAAAMSHDGISKARKNQQQGYNFRGIDDVLNALSSALIEAGLVILPRVTERTVTERETKNGGALFYVCVRCEFDLVAAEDGSKHTVVTYGEAMDSADKATNKAMSAAYKYLALLTFCIPTEASQDTDADFSAHEVKGNTPAAFAGRLSAGIQNDDACGAAAAFYGQTEEYKRAVWALLNAADKKAITAHKQEVTA